MFNEHKLQNHKSDDMNKEGNEKPLLMTKHDNVKNLKQTSLSMCIFYPVRCFHEEAKIKIINFQLSIPAEKTKYLLNVEPNIIII